MVVELNQDNLSDVVASESTVIVQYSATWCGNCRIMKPKFKKYNIIRYISEITILKIISF